MSVCIVTIKCFLGKIGERYSFKKKPESQHERTTSSEASLNEVTVAVMAHEDDPSTKDLVHNVTDEDGTIWQVLQIDVTNIRLTRAGYSHHQWRIFSRKSTTYQVTVQNPVTSALLTQQENILVISEKFFRSLPHIPQLPKVPTHKVTPASGDTLGPIGECDLPFRLRSKKFTDRLWYVYSTTGFM